MKTIHAPFLESTQDFRTHRTHSELRLCDYHDTRCYPPPPFPTSDSNASSSLSTHPKSVQISFFQLRITNLWLVSSPNAAIVVRYSLSRFPTPFLLCITPYSCLTTPIFDTGKAAASHFTIPELSPLDDVAILHFDGNKMIRHVMAILDATPLCPAQPRGFFSKTLLYSLH